MKGLSIAGTAAMFLVGGGILSHGVEPVHHAFEVLAQHVGAGLGGVVSTLLDAAVGIIAGAIVVAGATVARRVRP
jgi:predicted DNA repair protein MutK